MELVAAAAAVHGAISLFWAAILVGVLPRRRPLPWALAASMLIALLDLRAIAPWMFPEVARLPGLVLQWRWRQRA